MMQTVASLPWMYYSPTLDLTNSFQRQAAETYDKNAPMWKRVSLNTALEAYEPFNIQLKFSSNFNFVF